MKTRLLVGRRSRMYHSIRVSIFHWVAILLIIGSFAQTAQAQNCTVNANVDQTLCANAGLTLVGQASGLFPGGSAVSTWSQISGPSAVITSPNSLTTTVTSLIGGNTYKFRLSCPCLDGSIATDDQTVIILATPTVSAGSDFSPTCNASPAGTLAGNALLAGETGAWTQVGATPTGVFVNSAGSPTSTFNFTNGTQSGNVTLRWTKTTTLTGCIASDDVIIPKMGGVTPIAANASSPNDCFNTTTSVSLNGSYAGNGTGGQAGLWTVVSGPNVPTFSSATANNPTVSNLIQGTYTFKWTVTGPCASGSATATIVVPAPVGAATTATASIQGGPVMPVCNGITSFVLIGNSNLLATETGVWTQVSPALPLATITSPNTPTTQITVDGSSTYKFRYTITNPTGCSKSADVNISYGTTPTISILTPGPVMLDCGASQASISYSSTGSGDIAYSILSGPVTSTITPPTAWASVVAQPALIPGFTVPGTYVIRFRKVEGSGSGCNTDYKDITVIVSKSPTGSNSGSSQFLGCNVVSTTMAGNIPTVGAGKWTQVSGPNTAVFGNTLLYNSPISGLINGSYTFRWLISGGPACSTQQSDVIVRVATIAPTVADAGPDQALICYGSPTSMAGNLPILNETGTWTVSPSSGVSFSDTHSRFAVVNGLQASSTYTFTWTITNGCNSSNNTCIVTTTSTLGPEQSVAGPDQCRSTGTTSITLAGNIPGPSGATGAWTKYTGGSATITDATSNATTVTGMSDGTYQFVWTVSYGTCTVSRDTMMVTISASGTTANAGPDQSICGTAITLAANAASVGTGSWSQVSGGGGNTITDTSAYNSTVTNLSDGIYTFRWTVYNNACASNSNDVQINVSVPPTTAAAGDDQAVCNGTTATMAGNTALSGEGYWSLISGPNTPTITTPSSATSTVTGLTTGIYTFGWNIYSGPFCPTSSNEMYIEVVPAANAGAAQILCNATATTLTGNVSTVGTWSWVSGPTTPSNLPAAGSNVVQVTGLVPGVYVFQYAIAATAGCSATSSNVTVTISALPTTAAAGDDQSLCNATAWTMAANTPGIGTGSWTKIVGTNTPTFSSTSAPAATVTSATAQTYIYEWRITNGSCVSADRVTIVISNIPATANAGSDQSHVCGTEATLDATVPSSGLGNWTQISGPNTATISSLITNNSTITGLIEGVYVFRWTITSGSCTPVYDEVTISAFTNPTAANAGPDQNLCNATTATLAGNAISPGSGTWSVISGPSGSSFADASNPASAINDLVPGTYVLQWQSTLVSCTLPDQVTINNYATPTTSAASATVSNCLFTTLNLAGNAASVGTGAWTQTAGASVIISSPASPTTQILGAVAGSYTFRWTISNGACTASTSDEVVTVNEIPTMALAGPDQSNTCFTSTATLAGNTAEVGTGTWTQTSGPNTAVIANTHLKNTGLSGLINGTYTFNWEIANAGCTSNDNMHIVINYKTNDLSITKTDGSATYTSGTNNVYTIVINNAGPDLASGAVVTDNAPSGTSITSWTALFTGGATGTSSGTGNINRSINIPMGGTATYTVNLNIPCSFTGSLVNTANVNHTCNLDSNTGNNTATDTDANSAAVSVWNGSVSSDWNNPLNWTPNTLPGISPAVCANIPSGTPNNPIINNNGMSAAKLQIQNGATLTVNPGKDITVSGCTEINGPCGLSLKSDGISGNASFVNSGNGTITYPNSGTACVEAFIKSCQTGVGCWHYISSPVSNNNVGNVFEGDYVQYFDEVQGQWTFVSDGKTPMTPLQGFAINIEGTNDEIRTFRGHLNDGTVNRALTRTTTKGSGWNLVGNPYASEINLATTLNWSQIDQAVYYYDQAAGTYKVYPAASGYGTGSQYIPSMQGFYVHVNSANTSGNITFANANRTTTGDVNFYKSEAVDVLRLKVQGNSTLNDEAIVYFNQNLTSGFDKDMDCYRFNGVAEAPQLYSVATDNSKLTINGMPYKVDATVVPLDFNVTTNGTGNYTLTASSLESFRPGSSITLEDVKTKATQNLMLKPAYAFSFTDGDDPARFLLHFTTPTFGIIEQQDVKTMQIYSAGHEVFLRDLSSNPSGGELYMYDMLGQELAHKAVAATTLNKYTFSLTTGYYIVRVITKDRTYNSKVYIN